MCALGIFVDASPQIRLDRTTRKPAECPAVLKYKSEQHAGVQEEEAESNTPACVEWSSSTQSNMLQG